MISFVEKAEAMAHVRKQSGAARLSLCSLRRLCRTSVIDGHDSNRILWLNAHKVCGRGVSHRNIPIAPITSTL